MTRRRLTSTLAAIACGVVASAATAQIGASRTALVTVVDQRGRAIVDVEADDFVVRETGRARDVLSVRVADYPIALVLDNGLGAGPDFEAIRSAAARFVGRVGRRPIAIALADPVGLVTTFDDDRAIVMERLQAAAAGASGEGVFQAIALAAHAIEENGSPFSVIVVVSAAPVSSVPAELITPIVESGATVHVIVAGRNNASDSAVRSSDALRALADQTHGLLTTIYAAASYQAALDRLADRLAPQLMVEYVVPVGSSSGDDVQLGVRMPGARVVGQGVK